MHIEEPPWKPSAIQLLTNASLFASVIFVPLLAEEMGANESVIGIIVGFYYVAIFASTFVFGRLSDVHGRKRFLQAGLLLSTLACFVQIFANDIMSLLLARIFVGITAGIFPAALLAYVYESKAGIGKFISFGALGWGVGTTLAGILSNYDWIFLFSAASFAVSFLISLTLPFIKEVKMSVPRFPVKVIKKNMPIYLTILIRHSGASMIWVIYPIYLREIGATLFWIGIIYAINAVCQFLVMQYVDRFKAHNLIIGGFIVSAWTFFSFTLAKDWVQIMPTQITLAVSWALLYVGAMKYVMEKNVERATASGMLQSTLSMAMIFGSFIGGFTADYLGYINTMYVAAAGALVSLLIYLVMEKAKNKKEDAGTNK